MKIRDGKSAFSNSNICKLVQLFYNQNYRHGIHRLL